MCVHRLLTPVESFYSCHVSFGIIQNISAQLQVLSSPPAFPELPCPAWEWGSPSEHSFYPYSAQKFLCIFEVSYTISVTSWHLNSVFLFSVFAGTYMLESTAVSWLNSTRINSIRRESFQFIAYMNNIGETAVQIREKVPENHYLIY